MTQATENTKKSLFDTWIQDDHILVHLDARKDEVMVPAHLKDQHSLTLKLSMFFQGETKADDEKISSYLRFNNEYFECIIPWNAVWGMTSDQGVQKIWEQDLPKEVFHQLAKMMLQSVGEKIMAPLKRRTERKTEESKEAAPDKSTDTPESTPKSISSEKRKSSLKRIK